jgi:hypothetical protein
MRIFHEIKSRLNFGNACRLRTFLFSRFVSKNFKLQKKDYRTTYYLLLNMSAKFCLSHKGETEIEGDGNRILMKIYGPK